MYKFQFRGLQPFRVKYDDHGLLIFVVVNVFLQKTSFWMYHREKHAVFKRASRLKPNLWRTRKLQTFFFTPSLACYLPKKVLSAGAWLETTKSNLIIH